MTLGSPSVNVTQELVFWDAQDEPEMEATTVKEPFVGPRRPSMYVLAFEDMLKDVLLFEAHLFSNEELECLRAYNTLTYNARYLLIRLCLRKTDKWYRLSALKYSDELRDGIIPAMQELCGISPVTPDPQAKADPEEIKAEERDVIDLTLDEEDVKTVAGPLRIVDVQPKCEPNYSVFAADEILADLSELMECLSTDELKGLAKQMKVKGPTKRGELMAALMTVSSGQTTLNSFISRTRKGNNKSTVTAQQSQLGSKRSKQTTQQSRLREVVMRLLVKCIRISEDVVNLFRRINLVYFRSAAHTPDLLTPSLLSRFKKRAYAPYEYKRTPHIFPSRDALLAYEDALVLEAQVDFLLDGTGSDATVPCGRSVTSKTPAPPVKQKGTKGKGRATGKANDLESLHGEAQESVRVQNARAVKVIFEEAYPQWQELVRVKGEIEGQEKGLERFDCGHVLTRVVCKGSYALGILKQHAYELDVLEALLEQKRWRRGRRGRWYERRALILMTHTIKGLDEESEKQVLRRAHKAVTDALLDDDTHSIFRPKLVRRLTLLEKKLNIPEFERHKCLGRLDKAADVRIEGVRVWRRGTSLMLDYGGRVVNKANFIGQSPAALKQTQMTQYTQVPASQKLNAQEEVAGRWSGKSIWHGRSEEGDPAEVTVEQLALQHYEDQGFKGFHCEGRILTTLFGLLFWDVIFAPIAGAFETPYQTAPLDIAEDTFYFSRQDLADQRLQDLQGGKAGEILERIFEQHAAAKTFCVGVRWDAFSKEDLLHIAEFLGGAGLAVICRLFCDDYAGRGGGVPDLILWHTEKKVCKFVEVKGPGDTLQENQKVWIDVLLQAGIMVEVCRVSERGKANKAKGRVSKIDKGSGKPKRGHEDSDSDSEAAYIESEDEPEPNYSQMDLDPAQPSSPVTPKRRHVEVVIPSSPIDFASPARKRLRRDPSPEV